MCSRHPEYGHEAVEIARDPAPRFIAAKFVRQVDINWPLAW
jgi:hypothetical protein